MSLRLARSFARSKIVRLTSIPLLLSTIIVTALFITVSAFDQSSEQLGEQELGVFDYRYQPTGFAGGPSDAPFADTMVIDSRDAGAQDAVSLIETYDVRPAVPADPFTIYRETDWERQPFGSRYRLTSGSWPTSPGEVVVTESYLRAAGLSASSGGAPADTKVLSGNVTLQIVGISYDKYAINASQVMAAPGTWASFATPDIAARFPSLTASISILWTGSDPTTVTPAVQAGVNAAAEAETGTAGPDSDNTFENFVSRTDSSIAQPVSFIGSIPLAYTVPSLVLPVATAIFAFGLVAKRTRRNLGVLRAVGITSRKAAAGVVLASAFWQMIAVLVGAALGVGVGIAARQVAANYSPRELSPFANPALAIAQTLVLVLLCSVGAFFFFRNAGRRETSRSLLGGSTLSALASPARRTIILFALVACGIQAYQLNSVPGIMLMALTLTVAVLAATPEITNFLVERLPGDALRRRLIRQQLLGDRIRTQVAVSIVAGTVGLSFSMLVLLQTATASEEDQQVSYAAEGQVNLVVGGGGLLTPESPQLVSLIQGILPSAGEPIDVGYAYGVEPETIVRIDGSGSGAVLVVDDTDDALSLSNGLLTAEAVSVLNDGGVVLWDDTAPRVSLVQTDMTTEAELRSATNVPAVQSDFPQSWQFKAAGIMTRPAAIAMGFPVSHAEDVFVGISDDDAARLADEVLSRGFDINEVKTYTAPAPVIRPAAYVGAALGLSAVLVLATGGLARSLTRGIRPYLSGLVALGIPSDWVRNVVLGAMSFVLLIGSAMGLLIALPPIIFASLKIDAISLSIPWVQLIGVAVLFTTVGFVIAMFSARRVSALERLAR